MRHLAPCLLLLSLTACVAPLASDNAPPVFSPLSARVEVETGGVAQWTVSASDPDGDTVTLELAKAPAGARFVAPEGLGRFHWSPQASDIGFHEVVMVARDVHGATASLRAVIGVRPQGGE